MITYSDIINLMWNDDENTPIPSPEDINKLIERIRQEGRTQYKEKVKKNILFYKRTWEKDKDDMFNEGYMENLFNKFLSQLGDDEVKE